MTIEQLRQALGEFGDVVDLNTEEFLRVTGERFPALTVLRLIAYGHKAAKAANADGVDRFVMVRPSRVNPAGLVEIVRGEIALRKRLVGDVERFDGRRGFALRVRKGTLT